MIQWLTVSAAVTPGLLVKIDVYTKCTSQTCTPYYQNIAPTLLLIVFGS